MTLRTAIFLVLGIGLAGGAAAQNQAKGVFRKASPSIYEVVALDGNKKPTVLGTAFAVGDHLLATNYHIVQSASGLKIATAAGQTSIDVDGIKGVDPTHDLALIQTPAKLQPLKLSDRQVPVGEAVYVIGNPHGLTDTLSAGVVAAHREMEGKELYQITAPISPGSSGGPVMTADGRVIGVAASYIQGGQNLNFAIDAQQLRALIQDTSKDPIRQVVETSGAKGSPQNVTSVRIVDPHWQAGSRSITFDTTVANDGARAIKGIDLVIVASDQGGLVVQTFRKHVDARVQPGQTASAHFDVGLRGIKGDPSQWSLQFQVAGIAY